MRYTEQVPTHPLLKPYIEYYNSMQGEGIEGKQFISLPEGKIGMVFFLGGHSRIQKGNQIQTNRSSQIWGLIQEPNFVKISPDVFTFCVVFKPGGLYHFLPSISINEIAKASAELVDIFGKEIHRIEDQLLGCTNFNQRVAIIQQFLLQQMNPTNLRLQKAVQLIQHSHGNTDVYTISHHLNISSRQLRNIFNEKIGLAPKQFIRMMRFKNTLSCPPGFLENMAQYANRMGYYDESHFIHEFKLFAGMTPRKYFKNISFISDFSNFKRLMLA